MNIAHEKEYGQRFQSIPSHRVANVYYLEPQKSLRAPFDGDGPFLLKPASMAVRAKNKQRIRSWLVTHSELFAELRGPVAR